MEVGAAQADAALVRVWVRDNGVGIAANEMGQLFEKYRQGGNVKHSSHKGTGLGLVICKMIVEAHGGRIWVESTEGKRSDLFLLLAYQRLTVMNDSALPRGPTSYRHDAVFFSRSLFLLCAENF